MESDLKYVPFFRNKPEELKVLSSFDFGKHIFPYLEIVSCQGRKDLQDPFRNYVLGIVEKTKAKRVFIDIPTTIKLEKIKKKYPVEFLTKTRDMKERIRLLKSLNVTPYRKKIIPVVSSYYEINNETNTVISQVGELREVFDSIAFRTSEISFARDAEQIKNSYIPTDFIIVDFSEAQVDFDDLGYLSDLIKFLKEINCHKVLHFNPIPSNLPYSQLVNGEIVTQIDSKFVDNFNKLGGDSFSDFCGVKKDLLMSGGIISPGFIFYDATRNNYWGFRYLNGSHKKGEKSPQPEEFKTTIVPSVINSKPVERMLNCELDYLGEKNAGWMIIKNIQEGTDNKVSAAKFKRISMLHYIHCIKLNIEYEINKNK
jgi:hypothetical protein